MKGSGGIAFLSIAALATAADFPPQLDEEGRAEYLVYRQAFPHKAFAIAPGGAFGWSAEMPTPEAARTEALARCRLHTVQSCVLYALDERRVFDAVAWPRLWGPYLSRAEAARAPIGTRRGERFPDLAFTLPNGKKTTLRQQANKVVVLHFWASWCGPCRKELPALQRLYEKLASRRDIAFVLLQVREPIATARRWAHQQGLYMPLADSGALGDTDEFLLLADGNRLRDREIARKFPTTYVLDKHGIVLFTHVGPIPRWEEYEDFLLDAANRSGR